MITDPLFYLAAIPSLLLTGIGKGGFGQGLGALAVPLMALSVPVPIAGAIIVPILCTMDLIGLGRYRGVFDRENLKIMIPGALVGTLLGYLLFSVLHDDDIRLIVGVIALASPLRAWLRRGGTPPPAPRSWPKGLFWGAVSGVVSFVANAGGPPAQVYLLPQRLEKSVYVGTSIVFFTVVNYSKLVPFWLLGQFSAQNVTTALVLLPLAPLGMWLGFRLHQRIDQVRFYQLAHVILFVLGLKLTADGIARFL